MRGGDNLSIQVSADTSKLRAELARAEAELRGFSRELRKAADIGDTGQIQEFARRVDVASKSVAGFRRQLRTTQDTVKAPAAWSAASESVGKLHQAFTRFGGSLAQMSDKILPAWRTAFTLSLAGAGVALASFVNKANDSIDSLGDQADALGTTSKFVETYREITLRTGNAIDVADAGIEKLIKSLGQERIALAKTTGEVTHGVTAWRGGTNAVNEFRTDYSFGVKELRGGVKAVEDNSSVWRAFEIDVRQFEPTAEGTQQAIQALLKAFDEMPDRQKAAAKMSEAVGRGWAKLVEILRGVATQWDETQTRISGGLGFFTKEDQDRANAYKAALGGLQASAERARNRLGLALGPGLTRVFNDLDDRIQKNAQVIKRWADTLSVETGKVVDDLIKVFNNPQIDGRRLESTMGPIVVFFRDLSTKWIPDLISAFGMLASTLDRIAVAWNKIFGTQATAIDVGMIIALGSLTGAFKLLYVAMSSVVSLLVAGAPLLLAMGPTGWIVVGVAAIAAGILIVAQNWKTLSATLQQWATAFRSLLDGLGKWAEEVFQGIGNTIKNFFAGIFGAISSGMSEIPAGSSLSTGTPVIEGPLPEVLQAAGGSVPGSGSGDHVRALLEPGEFVVRKSAVRHYGTDMLRALNSQRYALGGLVDRLHAPVRGFADGGLVTATTADGVSVNLHFPGGTFALRGDKGIVAGLTREARRAAMLSGGRLAGIA